MSSLGQSVRRFWSALTTSTSDDKPAPDRVIVHDPDAERPHDLDDPFFDPQVQSRMAGVIADNAAGKTPRR